MADSIHQGKSYNPDDALESSIDGFLIDLDGTLYRPVPPLAYTGSGDQKQLRNEYDSGENDGMVGLCPGAQRFFAWLNATGKKWVLLSNTGAKGGQGTATKLANKKLGFCINTQELKEDPKWIIDRSKHIWTAAEAQMKWMVDNIPPNSKVFVLSGATKSGGTFRDSFWYQGLHNQDPAKVESWYVRTHIEQDEAMRWAFAGQQSWRAANKAKEEGSPDKVLPRVFVCLFTDGQLDPDLDTEDQQRYKDWNFHVIKLASFLLQHGAFFVYTADDAFNPYRDDSYPQLTFPLPGPGMIAQMLRFGMKPDGDDRFVCCGKGGTDGHVYMMQKGVDLLKEQGHSGDPKKIMMIGDRFDTDIRGGVSYEKFKIAGTGTPLNTCLVESGTHRRENQKSYPEDKATFYATCVGDLVPKSFEFKVRGDPIWPSSARPTLPSQLHGHGFHSHKQFETKSSKDVHSQSVTRVSASVSGAGFKCETATTNKQSMVAAMQDVADTLTSGLGGAPDFAVVSADAAWKPDAAQASWPGDTPKSGYVVVSSPQGGLASNGGYAAHLEGTEKGGTAVASFGIADAGGKYCVGAGANVDKAFASACCTDCTSPGEGNPAACFFFITKGVEELQAASRLDDLLADRFKPCDDQSVDSVPVVGGLVEGFLLASAGGSAPKDASVVVVLLWPTVSVRVTSGHMFDHLQGQNRPKGRVTKVSEDGKVVDRILDYARQDSQDQPAAEVYKYWSALQHRRAWHREGLGLAKVGLIRPFAVGSTTDLVDCRLVAPSELHGEEGQKGLRLHAKVNEGEELTVVQASPADLVGRLTTLDVGAADQGFEAQGVLSWLCAGIWTEHANLCDLEAEENMSIMAQYQPFMTMFPVGEYFPRADGSKHMTRFGNLMYTVVMFGSIEKQ